MGPAPNCHFMSKTTKGFGKIWKYSGHKGKVNPDETQHSEANRIDKIVIQDHLLKMLTNVKVRLNFKVKMANRNNSHIKPRELC